MTALSPEQLVREIRRQFAKPVPCGGLGNPSEELGRYLDGIVSGEIYAVPLPWNTLHRLTQALLPGTVTMVCGDPGVGKTFFILDCLRHWTNGGTEAAVFFVEKDKKFYLHRLLAQEEGNGNFINLGWIKANPAEVAAAMERHRDVLDSLGGRIEVEGVRTRTTLRSLHAWVQQELSNGRRVLVIDPITAAHAGENRWDADDWFMVETQKLLTRYGASLILVTHPRGGNSQRKTGHDMAAGAAYFRFSDTTLWITKPKKPKHVRVAGPCGYATLDNQRIEGSIKWHEVDDERAPVARRARRTGSKLSWDRLWSGSKRRSVLD